MAEEHHVGEAALEGRVVEPKVGGRWYEVTDDGATCEWGNAVAGPWGRLPGVQWASMSSPPRAERGLGLPFVALALCLLTPACGPPGPLAPASPSSAGERGPPGTLKVKFLPPRPGEEWHVVVGNRALCAAPCERWVDPDLPYAFKYDPGPLRRNEFIDIPDLRPYASLERVSVRVEGRSKAEFVGGIVATSFGGLGVVTGATLAAVGAALGSGKGGGGLYTAGVITLPASALLLAGGIYWVIDSRGEVHIEPAAVGSGGLYDPNPRSR